MMVIGKCNVKEIQTRCTEYNNKVCIAVYSSEEACVVSGDKDAIQDMKSKLDQEMPHLLKKELDVGCAYHSYHMNTVSKEIENKLFDISGKAPTIKLISTVTGTTIKDNAMGLPSYWTRNLTDPVLLKKAVACALHKNSINVIVEIGPKPVVKAHLKKITDFQAISIPSMNQPKEQYTFTCALGDLYEHRIHVKWSKLFKGDENVVDIPRYKFFREANLVNADSMKAGLRLEFKKTDNHPFISEAPMSKDFLVDINPNTAPYVYEHRVHGRKIAPGELHAEIGLTVATRVLSLSFTQIELDLQFIRPLAVGQDQSVELHAIISDNMYFEVKRNADTICKGKMNKAGRQILKHISLSQVKKRCKTQVKSSSFYGLLKMIGFEYGESLTVIGDCLKSEDEYVAEMNLPPSISSCLNSHSLHPSILDGALQTVALCCANIQENELQKRPIPVRIASLKVYKPMEPKMHIIGKRMQSTSSGISLNLFIVNEDGEIVIEIKGYEIKNIAQGVPQENINDKLYKIIWKPIDNSHEQSNEIRKIFSITFTNDAKQILEDIFKDENHYIVSLPFDYERITIQELLEVLFKYMETKFERTENISHILFFPGLSCRSIDQSTDEIFTAVKASCVVLANLIQHLVKERMGEIPTYIITKQTQMMVNNEGESWVNVIGSELWGMVRCILRERILSGLRLIDFDKEADLCLLKEIVFKSERGEFKNNPEFKIQGQRLYKNQIFKCLVEEPVYRKNTYNSREIVELRSSHHETLENLIFVPTKDNISNHKMSSNLVKMKVTSAFISDTWTPKTSTQATADLNPWLFHSKDGHQIISSETIGRLEQDTIVYNESATCFNSSKIGAQICLKHAEYVTCFPCAASNVINVPDKCILEKKLFPKYIPGMLLEIVMYFALVEHIKDNTPLVAFLDQDILLNSHLLECIFQYFKHKLMLHRNVESIKTAVTSGRYQIILLTTNLNEIEEIFNQLGSKRVLVYFFSSLMSKS